jgi:hypothetical protein
MTLLEQAGREVYLRYDSDHFVSLTPGSDARINGTYTADDLEALAAYMRKIAGDSYDKG